MAKKGKAKKSRRGVRAGGALGRVAETAASGLFGGGSSKKSVGSRRRSRGPNYWANKVLVEKLKNKFRRLKYGSVR